MGYAQLQDLVEFGNVDVVVAYHTDRLWRQTLEQQLFIPIARAGGLSRVEWTAGGSFDPQSPEDNFTQTIMSAVAQKSSDDTARRVLRAKLAKAKDRLPQGGGRRPFGYEPDGMTVVEKEATLIRTAIDDVLLGKSLSAITREWNDAGVTTTTGRAWQRKTLRQMLTSGRIAGQYRYQGELIGEAAWDAIVDADAWRRARGVIERHTRAQRFDEPVYLLTGIARCGKCGCTVTHEPGRMVKQASGTRRLVTRRYACRSIADGGCRGVQIDADRTDRIVIDRMVELIEAEKIMTKASRRQGTMELEVGQKLQAELAELQLTLGNVRDDHYRRRTMPRSEFLDYETDVLAQIRRCEDKLAGADPTRQRVLQLLGNAKSAADLLLSEDFPMVDRREALRLVFPRIVIAPSPTRGGRYFRDERIETFRTAEPEMPKTARRSGR